MAITFAKAPGKIILFGEHAVVYGEPAIAIPVANVSAKAQIIPTVEGIPGQIQLEAADIRLRANLQDLPASHPLAAAVRLTLAEISPAQLPAFKIQISSTLPISGGMGSGAAVTVAIVQALSAFLGKILTQEQVSAIAFEVEKIHHGTPSGIDNTVITYAQPIFFQRGQPIQFLTVEQPTRWVIADTGERTPTREAVAAVRTRYESNPDRFGAIFKAIGALTITARQALVTANLAELSRCMDENQRLLCELGVNNKSLEKLIQAAKAAGAIGAKLSGGGLGGNMIALTEPGHAEQVADALQAAGAARVISTTLKAEGV